jgi:hypothetical protein
LAKQRDGSVGRIQRGCWIGGLEFSLPRWIITGRRKDIRGKKERRKRRRR